MKKTLLLILIVSSLTNSATSLPSRNTTRLVLLPFIGGCLGASHTFLQDWHHHPDLEVIEALEQTEDNLAENRHQINQPTKGIGDFFGQIKARAAKYFNKKKVKSTVVELQLATEDEKTQLAHTHDKSKIRVILDAIKERVFAQELQMNKKTLMCQTSVGLLIGLVLAAVINS